MPTLTLTSTVTDIVNQFAVLDAAHAIGSAIVSTYAKGLKVFWGDTSRVIMDVSTMSVTPTGVRMVSPPYVDIPGGFNPNNPGVVPSVGGGTLTFSTFGAMNGNPPATNYATFDTINSIPVLDFPSGSTNGIFFVSTLPQGAVFASGLKVNLIWSSPVASGSVSWGAAFEDSQAAAISADHWLTQVTASAAANGTVNKPTVTSITVAALGALAPESAYRLRIQRVTGDTLAGVAQLIAVTVEAA